MKHPTPYSAHIRTSILVLTALILTAGCRTQDLQLDPNKAYFEIDSLTKIMTLPVIINDTIPAKMGFDTGATLNSFDLDSAFCAKHPLHLWQQEPIAVFPRNGVAWTQKRSQGNTLGYKGDFTVRIGQTDVNYKGLTVWNREAYFGKSTKHGLFNMPKSDTTHVWELNFEHNYIELHPSTTFLPPEGCLVTSLHFANNNKLNTTILIKITTSDGDTLTIERDFLIDSGMGQDIMIAGPTEELAFFEDKKSVPFYFVDNRYINRHIVDADIFDGFHIDSLRIYTLKDRGRLPTSYLIGLNFLKRFNVFFDLRNMRMYLQPLKEFRRAFSPLWKRFDINTSKTKSGSYLVTALGDHEFNPYKKAGLQVGDEIVGLNGVRLTPQTSREEHAKLLDNYKIVIDVLRNGKPIRLTMERDPNEIQDD